jgi:preprotein translocase subunit SecF
MQHTIELFLSVLTIVLAVAAIVVFAYTGTKGAFYIIVAVAIVVGFVNAWFISKVNTAELVGSAEAAPKKGSYRRKNSAGRS